MPRHGTIVLVLALLVTHQLINSLTYFSHAKTHLAAIEDSPSPHARIPSPPINKERSRDFASEEKEGEEAISSKSFEKT